MTCLASETPKFHLVFRPRDIPVTSGADGTVDCNCLDGSPSSTGRFCCNGALPDGLVVRFERGPGDTVKESGGVNDAWAGTGGEGFC